MSKAKTVSSLVELNVSAVIAGIRARRQKAQETLECLDRLLADFQATFGPEHVEQVKPDKPAAKPVAKSGDPSRKPHGFYEPVVFKAMTGLGRAATSLEIATAGNIPVGRARANLQRLAKIGRVVREGNYYRLPTRKDSEAEFEPVWNGAMKKPLS